MSESLNSSAPTPEDAVRIRAKPPQPRRLSRKVLLTAVGAAGAVVTLALLTGLSNPKDRNIAHIDKAPTSVPAAPEALEALPASYSAAELHPPSDAEPVDRLWGGHTPPDSYDPETDGADSDPEHLDPPQEAYWSEAAPSRPAVGYSAAGPSTNAQLPPDPAISPIFFSPRREGAQPVPVAARTREPGGETLQAIEGGGRRERFIARQQGSADVLDAPYLPPRSPFELQAGAIIPAALVTALNSDLPGRVIAQVTAPVYDSVSGDHLLIPQGARLIGTYDSANIYGDSRLFLVWNRIIMPNGWSLQLQGMEATDPTGASGLSDRTDNHLDRLGGAIGLSAVLSILSNEAEDQNGDAQRFTRSVGDAAAQEAARVGGRIIDRQLNVRPTLRVRPGAPVRVLVTRDIELRPYRE